MPSLRPDLENDIQHDVLHELSELTALYLCDSVLFLACLSGNINISDVKVTLNRYRP